MARQGTVAPTPLALPQEVADYRRTTTAALAQERHQHKGPPYKKLHGRVYYDWAEVQQWVEENTRVTSTDEPHPRP